MVANLFGVGDAHTHMLKKDAVVSREPGEEMPPGFLYSVGIHPWRAGSATQSDWQWLFDAACRDDVVAIGETGLDARRGAVLSVQVEVMRRHVELSEKLEKPLIIHNVHAHNQIAALHREVRPRQPWVVHGFRQGPQVAEMLLREGLYISLGARFNHLTAIVVPDDRLLLETDEATEPLDSIVARVYEARKRKI